MMSFERYKNDIAALVKEGDLLEVAMIVETFPEKGKDLKKEFLQTLPKFAERYQQWYSEAIVCISQLLPERLEDFKLYYSPARNRKEITNDTYTISDYLHGLTVTKGYLKEKVSGPDAATPKFRQQVSIVKSLERRFESSLFDIKALVQADVFENELDTADELNKKGFYRAAVGQLLV